MDMDEPQAGPSDERVELDTSAQSLQEHFDVHHEATQPWTRSMSSWSPSLLDPNSSGKSTPSRSVSRGRTKRRGRGGGTESERYSRSGGDQLNASTITGHLISYYFNEPKFCSPIVLAEPSQKLQGNDYKDILNCLLEDMKNKGFEFPSNTVEDLLQKNAASTPKAVDLRIQDGITKPMTTLLADYEFKYGSSKEQIKSYQTLLELIKARWGGTTITSPFIVILLGKIVKAALVPSDIADKDLSHSQFVEFWKYVLLHFESDIQEGDTSVEFIMSANGSGKNLRVWVIEEPNKKKASNEDNDNESDENIDVLDIISSKVINVKPDLLFEAKINYQQTTEKRKPRSTFFRSFCMEIKTKRDGFACLQQTGNEHAAERMSSPPSKRTKRSSSTEVDKAWSPGSESKSKLKAKMPNQFSFVEKFKTQHFMELIAMMKSNEQGLMAKLTKGQVHAFGLFVVMHRVYVTVLDVCKKDPSDCEFIDKEEFVFNNLRKGNKHLQYRMIGFKYFNMFNPEHLKALLEFMKYLVFHQYKEIDEF